MTHEEIAESTRFEYTTQTGKRISMPPDEEPLANFVTLPTWEYVEWLETRLTEATQNLWTDEDMIKAYNRGSTSMHIDGFQMEEADEWLNDYKQKKSNPATTN